MIKHIVRDIYRRLYEKIGLVKKIEYKRFHKNGYRKNEYELYRDEIIGFYKNSRDEDIIDIVSYLKDKKNDIGIFNGNWINYNSCNTCAIWDNENKMYYIIHNNNRMYFPKTFLTGATAESYYKGLMMEQRVESPHRYTTEHFCVNNAKCLLDIGGAEGIFALDNIDNAERIYIFECEDKWIEALNKTFEPFKSKVTIIKKYVSNVDDEKCISLDAFQKSIPEKIDFIKMDIEGAEVSALLGATKVLENDNLKLLVCAYHQEKDEEEIRKILCHFNIETSNGYMLFGPADQIRPPYFRRGVIRAAAIK